MKSKALDMGGESVEICYDKATEMNVELVAVKIGECNGYYVLDISKDDKFLIRLHIKEAIHLKAVIDNLVYDTTKTDFNPFCKEDKGCKCGEYFENLPDADFTVAKDAKLVVKK